MFGKRRKKWRKIIVIPISHSFPLVNWKLVKEKRRLSKVEHNLGKCWTSLNLDVYLTDYSVAFSQHIWIRRILILNSNGILNIYKYFLSWVQYDQQIRLQTFFRQIAFHLFISIFKGWFNNIDLLVNRSKETAVWSRLFNYSTNWNLILSM